MLSQFVFKNVCFEDKMTKYSSVWLVISFCAVDTQDQNN